VPSDSWYASLLGPSSLLSPTDRLVGHSLAWCAKASTIDEIAADTALGCSTIRNALKVLMIAGLAERTKNGARGQHARFCVVDNAVEAVEESVFKIEGLGRGTVENAALADDSRASADEARLESGATRDEPTPPSESLFTPEPPPPKPKRARKQDVVFDALLEHSDAELPADRGKLNTACKKIRGFCEGMQDEAIVAEIILREPLLRAKSATWPEETLYPHHYAEWWSRIMPKKRARLYACSCGVECPSPAALAEHRERIHG